jgi:glycosyltransferase involved in cell wall biosynthesis
MKVSVDLLTYNHEKFIAHALDSILMQQVDFDYEIVIGEDCSTDNTRNIVIDYQKRHPDKIRLLLHEKNVGSINNDIQVLKTCQGEYIAWLEGDDYWTSPHKLRKQVEYLDKHQGCSACFHPVTVFYENGSVEPYLSPCCSNRRRELSLEDLLESTTITTCSIMFRKSKLDESLIDVYSESVFGDWEFFIFLAQRGSIGYVDEAMAAYRKHNGGIYTGASSLNKLKDRIEMFKNLNAYLKFKYNKTYKELISQCNYALAIEYASSNNLSDARTHFIKSVFECLFNQRISRKDLFKLFVKLYVPPIYRLMGI